MCHFRDHLNNKYGRIVLNLACHLVSTHKMDRHSSKLEDLIAESLADKPLEIHSFRAKAYSFTIHQQF